MRLQLLVGNGFVVGRPAPVLVGLEHVAVEAFVILVQGVDEEILPFSNSPHPRQHGIVLRGKALQLELSVRGGRDVLGERVGGEILSELHLGGATDHQDLVVAQTLAILEHLIGQLLVNGLKRVDGLRDPRFVSVLAGKRIVTSGEPVAAGGIRYRHLDRQVLSGGMQDLAFHDDVHGVRGSGYNPNRTPVAGALQQVLCHVRNEVRFCTADLGLDELLDLFVIAFRHVRVEDGNADVQQLFLALNAVELLGSGHVYGSDNLLNATR